MQRPDHNIQIDPLRPRLHFTPTSGWINDPNGLIYFEGEYHLFYQHNPAATVWGPMHWGHAISRDLVTWQELPIALAPDDIGTIFSGSAVIDRNNTAGFGANAMIAIFTHDTQKPLQKQMQSLAYSNDRGRTWTKYAGNPVLLPPTGHKDFRDPKVFWYESGARSHWVMALAVGNEIRFYSSSNLKDWTESSQFGATFGNHSGVWECPELIQLNVEGSDERHWVLIVSVGSGAPAGGCGVQYFVGQFDGITFTPHHAPNTTRWADFGADFYAPQSWTNAPDGRKLWIGWMNNWSYGNKIPDSGGWRGSMSVVRELSLHRDGQDLSLIQQPVRELVHSCRRCGSLNAQRIDNDELAIDLTCDPSQSDAPLAQEITVTFRIDANTTAQFLGLKLRGRHNESIVVGYNTQQNKLIVNRENSGPKLPEFVVPHLASLHPYAGKIKLHVLVDQTSIEVFADNGRLVMTEQMFLNPTVVTLALFANGGAVDLDSLDLNWLYPRSVAGVQVITSQPID